jgi:hypothetical protein
MFIDGTGKRRRVDACEEHAEDLGGTALLFRWYRRFQRLRLGERLVDVAGWFTSQSSRHTKIPGAFRLTLPLETSSGGVSSDARSNRMR